MSWLRDTCCRGCRRVLAVSLVLAWLCPAWGEEDGALAAAAARTRADVAAARQALSELQERIRGERLRMVDAIESERNGIEAVRQQRTEVLNQVDSVQVEMEALRRERSELSRLQAYIDTAATEYRQAFGTRLGPADAERLGPRLEAVDAQLTASDGASADALATLLEISGAHSRQGIGGMRYSGEALGPDGVKVSGHFAQFGPVTYFSSTDGGVTGLAVQRVGSTLPTVFAGFDEEESAAISALVSSGSAEVPVDVTLGFGVRLREARETVIEHIEKGGITIIPLFALAGVCGLLAVYKFLALFFVATGRARGQVVRIVELLRRGEDAEATARARRLRRPLGPVICQGIQYRDAPKEHLEEILYEQIIAQIPRLERFLTPLAVCASAAPLLGLLGTVTGMIHTFRLITVFGTGDARLLSSGISEALVTTEIGLMIAIPALLIHAFLSRRVRRTIAVTQETAVIFVNGLKLGTGGNVTDSEAADTQPGAGSGDA